MVLAKSSKDRRPGSVGQAKSTQMANREPISPRMANGEPTSPRGPVGGTGHGPRLQRNDASNAHASNTYDEELSELSLAKRELLHDALKQLRIAESKISEALSEEGLRLDGDDVNDALHVIPNLKHGNTPCSSLHRLTADPHRLHHVSSVTLAAAMDECSPHEAVQSGDATTNSAKYNGSKSGTSETVVPTAGFDASQAIVQKLESTIPDAIISSMFPETPVLQAFKPPVIHYVWASVGKGRGRLRFPMLHPDTKFRLIWLAMGLCFTLIDAFSVPYQLAFETIPEGFVLRALVNCYYLIDIPLTFITGFTNDVGITNMDPRAVAKRYLCSWFLPDFFAAIPWDFIDMASDGDDGDTKFMRSLRLVRALRMIRLVRVFRIAKLRKILEVAESSIEGNHMLMFCSGMFRCALTLFFIAHWAACFWWIVGKMKPDDNWATANLSDDIRADPSSSYVTSLYFAMMTMTTVGFGDITPTNFDEMRFVLGLLCIASVVFSAQLGVLADFISHVNKYKAEIQEKKITLARYMVWRAVPRGLRKTIRNHLIFLWETNEGHDAYEEDLKNMLPPVLRNDLCYHIYGGILRSTPFFSWMADYPSVVKEIAGCASSMFLAVGDCIFHLGDPNQTIYIILLGVCRLGCNEQIELNKDTDNDIKIPRAKGGQSIIQMGSKMIHHQTSAVKHKTEDIIKKMALQKSETGSSFDLSKKMPKKEELTSRIPKSPYHHGRAYEEVALLLRREDVRQLSAAKYLQRRWRRKQQRREAEVAKTGSEAKSASKGVKLSAIPTTKIHAPAFLGESCLWTHPSSWDFDDRRHPYSAWCVERTEIVSIPRFAIQESLKKHSPWLEERLLFFQEKLQAAHKTHKDYQELMTDFKEVPKATEEVPKSSQEVQEGIQQSPQSNNSAETPYLDFTEPTSLDMSEQQSHQLNSKSSMKL